MGRIPIQDSKCKENEKPNGYSIEGMGIVEN